VDHALRHVLATCMFVEERRRSERVGCPGEAFKARATCPYARLISDGRLDPTNTSDDPLAFVIAMTGGEDDSGRSRDCMRVNEFT